MHAYDERSHIKRVVTLAGLAWPKAPGGTASAEELWTWALEAAVKSGALFELYGVVLEDGDSRAFHGALKGLFGGGLAMGYTRRLGPDGLGPESIEVVNRKLNEALHAAASDGGEGLQSVNIASLGFVDAQSDLQMRRDALRRTAMIEVGGRPAGTGFLVGPDLLLTAAHVLDARHWPPQLGGHSVVAIFDFVPDATRSPAESGVPVAVADPAVAGSLPTASEVAGRASDWNADLGHLDFVLLRLARDVAADQSGGSARGFYPLSTDRYIFDDQAHLRIPQHPLGQTQVTAPAAGPFEINPNGTRVRYRGNTLPGSSGSAVLDMRGRVVAMHHFAKQGLNQGVLIHAIAQHIKDAGIGLPTATSASPAATSASPVATAITILDAAAVAPDPFETTHFGRRPFANRDDFRGVIKRMLTSDQDRILVIEGGQDAGKTYSWRFLTHLEDQREHPKVKSFAPGGVRAVKVDLDEYTNVSRDALCSNIVNHLCVSMGLVATDTLEQPVRTIANLISLLDARLNGSTIIWWIFFDSLDRHVLEHGQVDELIAKLGLLIDEKPALPLRLVLSSRTAVKLPGDLGQWALRDHAFGLSRTDVENWLRRGAAQRNRQVDDAALAAELDKHFSSNASAPSALVLAPELPRMLSAVLGGSR